jgi:hypothetical protein
LLKVKRVSRIFIDVSYKRYIKIMRYPEELQDCFTMLSRRYYSIVIYICYKIAIFDVSYVKTELLFDCYFGAIFLIHCRGIKWSKETIYRPLSVSLLGQCSLESIKDGGQDQFSRLVYI